MMTRLVVLSCLGLTACVFTTFSELGSGSDQGSGSSQGSGGSDACVDFTGTSPTVDLVVQRPARLRSRAAGS
jgi:hypothetical protein